MPETCISVDCTPASLTNHQRRNLGRWCIRRAHHTPYEGSVWQCPAVHVRCGRSLGSTQAFILCSVLNMYHYKMRVFVAKMEQIIPSDSTQSELTKIDLTQSDSTQSDSTQSNSYIEDLVACPRHPRPKISSSCYKRWIPLSLAGIHQEFLQISIIARATSHAWATLKRQREDVTMALHTRTNSKLPD